MHLPGERAYTVGLIGLVILVVFLLARGFLLLFSFLDWHIEPALCYIAASVSVSVFGFVWYNGRKDDEKDK